MDPEDYAAFLADQKDNGTRSTQARFSAARVPIVFNNEHPTSALRGKSFLPFTFPLSQGEGGSFMTILYLDFKDLPVQLKRRLRSASRSISVHPEPELVAGAAVI
jgi:hypothetical protein